MNTSRLKIIRIFALIATLIISANAISKTHYKFTSDWFSLNIPNWNTHLGDYSGKPLNYLEVGVYEGRSFFWFLENIGTNIKSKAYAVDVFRPEVLQRFKANLNKYPGREKVIIKRGLSSDVLPTLEKQYFDIIYIDGSHESKDVLTDAINAWRLLKDGGLIIFDDYKMQGRGVPSQLLPRVSIDAFLNIFRDDLEVVSKDWQILARKRLVCKSQESNFVSKLGDYCYYWNPYKLKSHYRGLYTSEGKKLTLGKALTGEIETYLKAQVEDKGKVTSLNKKIEKANTKL